MLLTLQKHEALWHSQQIKEKVWVSQSEFESLNEKEKLNYQVMNKDCS